MSEETEGQDIRLQNLWDGIVTYSSMMAQLNWAPVAVIAVILRQTFIAHGLLRRVA